MLCSPTALCLVSIAALLACAFSASPWFCHDLDCPPYTVLDKKETYEVRTYDKGLWASTNVSSVSFRNASQVGFDRLFNYISGENESRSKINMTVPVRVAIKPSQGPFCESSFVVSFFVPFAYQQAAKSPPKPTNPEVYINSYGADTWAVIQYPGFYTDDNVASNAKALQDALTRDQVSFDSSSYVFAGYDSPFRILNRHNEVWIKVQI